MAATTDLLYQPACELADLLRVGDVSSRELVEAALDRIDAVDGEVNAFTLVDREGALAAADSIGPGDERPFAGVPIAIKDLGAPVAGLVLSEGSRFFGDFTPGYDAYVVRRLRQAGFVIVGKTSSPELGILPITEPRRFGPTRNPWDTERTPGGSSGGSGAAVSAGMAPIAHGSDGGGSIRIPAACCGLVGLKPSRGRVSHGPDLGDSFLATDGALARTVRDAAAILDVISGYEPGDATWAPPPFEPFAETAARPPGKLRVGLALEPPLEAQVDPVCAQAARDAAELLEELGHAVEEAPRPEVPDLLATFTDLWAGLIGMAVVYGRLVTGREPGPDDLEPLTRWLYELAGSNSSLTYLTALMQLQRVARELVQALSAYDVLLTPALAKRPLRIGEIDPCGPDPAAEFQKAADFTPFTAIANLTGQPALSVPLFDGDDGLPLAVQFIGPPLGEGLLLSLAGQLEAARPWADRRPAL